LKAEPGNIGAEIAPPITANKSQLVDKTEKTNNRPSLIGKKAKKGKDNAYQFEDSEDSCEEKNAEQPEQNEAKAPKEQDPNLPKNPYATKQVPLSSKNSNKPSGFKFNECDDDEESDDNGQL